MTHDLSLSRANDCVDIYSRLGLERPADTQLQADRDKAVKLGYSWVPSGLTAKQVMLLNVVVNV